MTAKPTIAARSTRPFEHVRTVTAFVEDSDAAANWYGELSGVR
ncbi:hypothetical protein [Streptomyces sp. H27-D2]|nr:hypothetical protein [Streptomyces sp. H27-D2]MEC4016357.1 hypothetical protein [Streptomyces sp. H27-D2]